jgi:peroxiredoxin
VSSNSYVLKQSRSSRKKSILASLTAILGLTFLLHAQSRAQDDKPPTGDVPPILKIGSQAPDFNLPGIDGKMHSLKDYASSKVLVVIFNCDHCPVASMYEQRIKQLTSDYKDRGVSVVVIMGNDPKAIHLSEMGHTDLGDTLPEMKQRAEYRHFNYPYLYDGATQSVALKYGPTATPHVFIFDQQRILQYQGRIDNNYRGNPTKREARDAIDALLAGKPVEVQNTPAVGCSTKWAYKEAGASAEISKGDQKPVSVEMVSADELKALRQNSGTDKLLLVNFWATWCGPCMEEFPELQKMVRMYANRAVNIVTVSINTPDEKDFVLKFLQEQHAINRNLQFSGNDSADAVAAFGAKDWSGGVPFTALIDTKGEILYKTQGGMNALEVRRALLKNLPDDRYVGQHAYWNSTF